MSAVSSEVITTPLVPRGSPDGVPLKRAGTDPVSTRAHLLVLLGGLFASGISGLIHQVVWQRALKVFLGGSEALSSMVVVLVFILGLGVGSILMGAQASRLKNPMKLLVLVEGLLFSVNMLIAVLLGLDLTESIYAFQRLAVSAGVPLRFVYGVSALVLLLPPCVLMGMTVPAAAEVAQRQLGCKQSTLINILFFVNTLGAVVGALASGFVLLPYLGQVAALFVGAGGNLVAGLLLLVLCGRHYWKSQPPVAQPDALGGFGRWLTPENNAGFLLGFLALAYEMYLFRLVAIAHLPLPYTFATTLCLFLLFWSAGVYLASLCRERLSRQLLALAFLLAAMPLLYKTDRWGGNFSLLGIGLAYFLPCLFFGSVFGHLASSVEKHWGSHVGRFYAFNTLGSSLGILTLTLIGYEQDNDYNAWIISLGVLGVFCYLSSADRGRQGLTPRKYLFAGKVFSAAGIIALLGIGLYLPYSQRTYYWRSFFGKDGVIEIHQDTDLIWDGLWHSHLSSKDNHLGTTNWLLAAAPILCHSGPPIKDTLVIGLGTGITAATLARLDSVERVDVYDINRTLKAILAEYPNGTLRVAENPKIHIHWRDGRSGLALDPTRYDLITQQPLYLKQAGSSILLSREYMELVKSRLKAFGVFCIYSNSQGNEEQGLLVRETASTVFAHCVSFLRGGLIVASDDPLHLDKEKVARLLSRPDRIFQEARRLDRRFRERGREHHQLMDLYDGEELTWTGGGYVITDDHPLVEYPGAVKRLVTIPSPN